MRGRAACALPIGGGALFCGLVGFSFRLSPFLVPFLCSGSLSLASPVLVGLWASVLASLDYGSTPAGPERMRAAVPLEDLTIGAKGGQNRLKRGKN